MRWVGNVAGMKEITNTNKPLLGKPQKNKDEIGGTCSRHGRYKYVQSFTWKT